MIDQLEGAIAALLGPLALLGFTVERTPETVQALDAAIEKGTATVVYRDSEFREPANLSVPIQQEEVITFHIVVRGRRLQENTGIYFLLSYIRKRLLGRVAVVGSKPLWAVKQSFEALDKQTGLWRYSLIVSTSVLAVSMPDPNAEEVLFTAAAIYFAPDGPGSATEVERP